MRTATIVAGLVAAIVIGHAPAILAEETHHQCEPYDGSCGFIDPDPHGTGLPPWVWGNYYGPGWYYGHWWRGGLWHGRW